MIQGFFAVGAEVKVLADNAPVTDSNDRINFAAITCETLVNMLKVLDNISDNIFDQFSFLEGKALDIEFVRLAGDYRWLVWLLEQAEAIDPIFFS